MQTRTEDQKVLKAPIEVTFGDKKYKIKLLAIEAAREWRVKLNEVLGPIADGWQNTNGLVSRGLADALLAFPDKLAEMIFAYAPDLPRDEVLAAATDEQMSEAFQDVLTVAYPYLTSLVTVIRFIRPTESR